MEERESECGAAFLQASMTPMTAMSLLNHTLRGRPFFFFKIVGIIYIYIQL